MPLQIIDKKVGITLVTALAGLFTSVVPAVAADSSPSNLLKNAGFESDADDDGWPDDWQFAWETTHSGDTQRKGQKQRPDVAWDRTTFFSGARSLQVGVTRKPDDGAWTQDGIRHVPGTRIYRLSAAIKTASLSDTDARVALVLLGANGKWLGADYSAITVTENCDWTEYVRLGTVIDEKLPVRSDLLTYVR